MITCKDCVRALHPFVDRELSVDDIAQVRSHLDACPRCLHLYEFEESLQRLVRVRCRETHAPDSLRARILVRFAEERLRQARREPRFNSDA